MPDGPGLWVKHKLLLVFDSPIAFTTKSCTTCVAVAIDLNVLVQELILSIHLVVMLKLCEMLLQDRLLPVGIQHFEHFQEQLRQVFGYFLCFVEVFWNLFIRNVLAMLSQNPDCSLFVIHLLLFILTYHHTLEVLSFHKRCKQVIVNSSIFVVPLETKSCYSLCKFAVLYLVDANIKTFFEFS